MEIKPGATIAGLDIRMRPALITAEAIWKGLSRSEGVTITSGLDGCHSAGSVHYYGLAVDLRTRYFNKAQVAHAVAELRTQLGVSFSVIDEGDHIHVGYRLK